MLTIWDMETGEVIEETADASAASPQAPLATPQPRLQTWPEAGVAEQPAPLPTPLADVNIADFIKKMTR